MATAKIPQPEEIPAIPARSRIDATLSLDFRRDAATNRTILDASAQQPPLRVVRAFELADGAALAHLHNVSGGLLGGDRLKLWVNVGANAGAQLTTTGATRIYRPSVGAPATTQVNEIAVGENALLEFVPDAIIPFAGVRFAQHTTINLAPGAGLFWWEIVAPGREARGEIFEYDTLEMKTDVFAPDTTGNIRGIAAERIHLDPRNRPLASPARLGPYRYWSTFFICRIGLAPAAWLAAESHLREAAAPLVRPYETQWGVSTLLAGGLVIRGLSCRGRDLVSGLHALWRAAKLHLYAREPIFPRKVH
jgi:urease accessory protein